MTDLQDKIQLMGERAVAAARHLALLSSPKRNSILQAMADALETRAPELQEANAADMKLAREAGMSAALLDRLRARSLHAAAASYTPAWGQAC